MIRCTSIMQQATLPDHPQTMNTTNTTCSFFLSIFPLCCKAEQSTQEKQDVVDVKR